MIAATRNDREDALGRHGIPIVLVTHSGERWRHDSAAMVTGLLAIGFGLLAPAFTGLMLAMLRVLQASVIASKERFTLGALVSFLVTVTDLAMLNIGAAFWDLIAGFAVSWLLRRHDFAARTERA